MRTIHAYVGHEVKKACGQFLVSKAGNVNYLRDLLESHPSVRSNKGFLLWLQPPVIYAVLYVHEAFDETILTCITLDILKYQNQY